jgi:ribosome maturation factor RimP
VAKTDDIIKKIEEIVLRAGRERGIEPVEVQLVGGGNNRVLRIYIDRPEAPPNEDGTPAGVTHADCEFISEYVGTVIDVEDIMPGGSYTLEVSSPGIERKLTTARDFERHINKKIKLALRDPIVGKNAWEGLLTGFQDNTLTLQPERKGKPEGEPIAIPLTNITRANLKFEW